MSRARAILDSDVALTGLMLQELRSDLVIRVIEASGFDLVIIDMEHGTFDLGEVAHVAHLCRLVGLTPLVRPPDHEYASVARALDAGAAGIMAPRVSSPEQVDQILTAMRYPPEGSRGMASQRGHTDYLPVADRVALAAQMNRDVLLVVQIELAEAVARIEEILAVPGIDVALVGPSDLTVSLGGRDGLDEAIQRVVDAGERLGVPTGIQTSDRGELLRWRRAGMQLLVLGTEVKLVTSAFQDGGEQLRAIAKEERQAGQRP